MFNNNEDVIVRIMEFLGPRHVCLGLGSTCYDIRIISQSDSLWKVFWGARCCLLLDPEAEVVLSDGGSYVDDVESDTTTATTTTTDAIGPHDAAITFRHAMHTMNLTCKIITARQCKHTDYKNDELQPANVNDGGTMSLYYAYIIQHLSMKESNLRVQRLLNNEPKLIHRTCTKTWARQLSPPHNDADPQNRNSRVETCQKSAVVWCDYPDCQVAFCGVQGCSRSYRFAFPMGSNRDFLSFVQCPWCHVSFCWDHVYSRQNGYYEQRNNNIGRRLQQQEQEEGSCKDGTRLTTKKTAPWYKCDECNLSSCPDCASQVFLATPPNMDGCGVVTAGEVCRRTICSQCIWYVGRKKRGGDTNSNSGNVPGGDYTKLCKTEVCTVRGRYLLASNTTSKYEDYLECWDEFETCCTKCLRHVDFRWRELTRVHDSFQGYMP